MFVVLLFRENSVKDTLARILEIEIMFVPLKLFLFQNVRCSTVDLFINYTFCCALLKYTC